MSDNRCFYCEAYPGHRHADHCPMRKHRPSVVESTIMGRPVWWGACSCGWKSGACGCAKTAENAAMQHVETMQRTEKIA